MRSMHIDRQAPEVTAPACSRHHFRVAHSSTTIRLLDRQRTARPAANSTSDSTQHYHQQTAVQTAHGPTTSRHGAGRCWTDRPAASRAIQIAPGTPQKKSFPRGRASAISSCLTESCRDTLTLTPRSGSTRTRASRCRAAWAASSAAISSSDSFIPSSSWRSWSLSCARDHSSCICERQGYIASQKAETM